MLKKAPFIAFLAIVYYFYRKGPQEELPKETTFTAEELSRFDGIHNKELYLALMGKIYDVTSGETHYGPGGGYNVFVGRDASRAFITGEFDETISDLDDVSKLSPKDLVDLENWFQLYDQQYIYKGKLIGRYYDSEGRETDYLKAIRAKIEEGKIENFEKKQMSRLYPSCNSEWSDSGSRVWCTTRSGGVERDWEGVPRQMHVPGLSEVTCVCIDIRNEEHMSNPHLREYPGCDSKSKSCNLVVK